MPKQIEFDGTVHEFPDDFTDQDIAAALSAETAPQAAAPPPSTNAWPASIGGPGWKEQMDARSGELRQNAVDHPISTAANIALTGAGPGILKAIPKVPGILAKGLGISAARGGENIATAMRGAAQTPLDLTAVAPILEETKAAAAYLGSRKAIGTLAKRAADTANPMLAPEGQKAASALSALTQGTMNPAMKRQVVKLAQSLRTATAEAADAAARNNLGAASTPGQYLKGVKEYGRAMKAKSMAKTAAKATGVLGGLDWLRRSALDALKGAGK